MFEFRFKFHWSLFPRVQLTIIQHWFRWWLGAVQATSHYLNQWWLVNRRIYTSLGLNELKRVAENFLWQQMHIDDMQLSSMPGCSTCEALFVVRQLQEKSHAAKKTLFMAFVGLEKSIQSCIQTCYLVGSSQAWHCKWLVRFIERIYGYARSRVCVGCNLSSVRKLAFTKANAWVPWCSSWFWKPSPRVLYMISLRIPAYRKPGHHLWISGITARKADSLEEYEHGRHETSGQHGQNHGPDICPRTRCSSAV